MPLPRVRVQLIWMRDQHTSLIARQDRRVVVKQRPHASALTMGERLIQADRPIVEYRKRRQQLMQEGETSGP